jgi:gliding motility-associated-like protein
MLKNRIFLLFLFQIVYAIGLFGQETNAVDIVNKYAKVTAIFYQINSKPTSIKIDSLYKNNVRLFKNGDTVLLHQAQDVVLKYDKSSDSTMLGDANYGTFGRFEIHIIDHVDTINSIIKLMGNIKADTTTLDSSFNFKPQHSLQIVKVKSYNKKYSVTKEITAQAWNGQTGGIVAIIADTLELKANIDVTGKGFRGAIPVNSNAVCSKQNYKITTMDSFSDASIDSAGLKGESGVVTKLFPRGRGWSANGGGGGNGFHSGGGGGGSYLSDGGIGGFEAGDCGFFSTRTTGGRGGNYSDDIKNALAIFGGGGGSGTQAEGFPSSKGGNGGGVVILMANKIISNSFSIIAKGETVTYNSISGAGGGGGGGGVLIDIDKNNLGLPININISGGNGGNASDTLMGSPGGGGGGGYVNHNGTTFLTSKITKSEGLFGNFSLRTNSSFRRSATSGKEGNILGNLIMPLNNYFFNVMPDDQKICENDTPKIFIASKPKGSSDDNFIFQWQTSTDTAKTKVWANIDTAKSIHFKYPDTLQVNRYFRRIVTLIDDPSKSDTSIYLTVEVYHLNNNFIQTNKGIICQKAYTDSIYGNPTGREVQNDYRFIWEVDTTGTFLPLSNDTFKVLKSFKTYTLNEYKFRRIVYLGQRSCLNTSDTVTISTRPYIENNIITSQNDSIICYNQSPGKFICDTLSGGDLPNSYSYKWLQLNTNNWELISNDSTYISPDLIETTSIRRLVTSGVCSDSGKVFKTTVLPLISNTLGSTSHNVCNETQLHKLEGNIPSGGDGSYKYIWQSKLNNEQWIDAIGVSNDTNYIIPIITNKTYFRRKVFSGLKDCCQSTTDSIYIEVDSLPKASFVNFEKSMCSNIPYTFAINLTGKPNFNLTYSNGFTSFYVNNISTSTFNLQITPDNENTFQYQITKLIDGNNCEAKPIESIGIIKAYTKPTIFAGNDTTLCGPTIKLPAKLSNGVGFWKSSSPVTFTDSAQQPNAIANIGSDYGTKQFTWIETNGVCSDSVIINITFEEQPLEALAGSDQTASLLFSTTINATIPFVGQGIWSSPNNKIAIKDVYNPTTTIDSLTSGENFIVWTVSNGTCKPVIDTLVINSKNLVIYSGFSPNNDKVNDFFEIDGLGKQQDGNYDVSNAELLVFNKWGKEVFHDTNYHNTWDGKSGNSDIPDDTYYFTLKVMGRTYNGFVVIKR